MSIRSIVEQQVNDPSLWFEARTLPEAHLQAALRRLHRAVEESRIPLNYLTMVKEFHDKFKLSYDGPPRNLTDEEREFRSKFLLEECDEVRQEMYFRNIERTAAELCDLIWIACGVAHRMGIDLDQHFQAIYEANMRKELAGTPERSKRGYAWDIIKPEGWEPPDHKKILQGYSTMEPETGKRTGT